jgi:hypothetical protein
MRRGVALTIGLAAAGVLTVAAPRAVRADEPVVIEAPAAAPTTSAELLASADAAVDAGNLQSAAAIYAQIAREHASSREADEARRALKIIAAIRAAPPGQLPDLSPPGSSDGSGGVVVRREPFSLRTQERLRLTTWEKLDFGTTAFLYGMSVGFSFALGSLDTEGAGIGVAPVAIGALVYTIGAVAYLQSGEPDRGDLPLALAITSFLPTTVLLVANVVSVNADQKNVALMTAGTGLLSVPIAIVAARRLSLDPGDTQLVRDAGFWGLVLGTTTMLAFGDETVTYPGGYTSRQGPSDRKVFTSSLIGLYGALGLGVIAAANSEVSLERVRVTTWGGYGGAVIGLLVGASVADNDSDVWKGLTIGSAAGLIITFLATSSLDGIPDDDPTASVRRKPPRFMPSLLPVAGIDGRAHPALGITGLAF